MESPYATRAQLAACGIQYVRLYTSKECSRLMAALGSAADWEAAHVSTATHPGDTASEHRPDVRLAEVSGFQGRRRVMNQFCRRIEQKLLPPLRTEFGKPDIEAYEFTAIRYGPGGRYLPHRDNGGALDHRAFSVVCYLNDDFAGGGTAFPDLGFQVQPQAGMAIAFPSEYLHAALPVVSGCKQVLVSWIKGGPAIEWI